MKTYIVHYAEDCPCYGLLEIHAASDGEAIARAIAQGNDRVVSDPDYAGAFNRRIVMIEQGDETIAEDIPLDLEQEQSLAVMALRNAARDMFDALQKAKFELDFQRKHFPRSDDTELRETLRIIDAALTKAGGNAS